MKEMTLEDHLEELRARLKKILLILFLIRSFVAGSSRNVAAFYWHSLKWIPPLGELDLYIPDARRKRCPTPCPILLLTFFPLRSLLFPFCCLSLVRHRHLIKDPLCFACFAFPHPITNPSTQ